MTLVGTVLNLGEKIKRYPQVLTFFIKPQIWLFHVVVFAFDDKKMDKREKRSCRAFFPTKYANL